MRIFAWLVDMAKTIIRYTLNGIGVDNDIVK